MAQMGGVRGLIYSALPVAVLVPVNTAFGLVPAISAALGAMSGTSLDGVDAALLEYIAKRKDSMPDAFT